MNNAKQWSNSKIRVFQCDMQVLVFLTTARATQLYAQLFQAIGFPALEIHSRKSQAARTRTSEEFRKGKRVVLFTSDVSARGVDYPDVSMVLQVRLFFQTAKVDESFSSFCGRYRVAHADYKMEVAACCTP
jgi:superfamily II DNA/RNA helicase